MDILKGLLRKLKEKAGLNGMEKPMLLLASYMARYWVVHACLVVLLLIGIGVTLQFTWFLQNITDAAAAGNLDRVKQLILLGCLFVAVSSMIAYGGTYFQAMAINQVKRDMKNDLFKHLLRLPYRFSGSHHSGELVSRLTNDINSVEGAVGNNLLQLFRLPLMAGAAFLYLVQLSWQLAMLCVLIGPFAMVSGLLLGRVLRKYSKEIHAFLGRQNSFLNDVFTGQTVIRSFSLERLMAERFGGHNEKLLSMELRLARIRGWFQVGAGAASSLAFFMTLGIGAHFVAQGSLSIGALLAFVSLMQYLIQPLTGLAGIWGAFQRSLAAVERISQVMEETVETRMLPMPESGAKLEYGVQLRNVTFGYEENRSVLHRIQLHVPAGRMVALVGPSGAGKSTLFQLLLGFYKPCSGDILFDGCSSEAIRLDQLRSYSSYVPQDTYLFAGTIRDNILYGRLHASELDVVRAAKDANAHDFILALPNGYETEVGERGAALSGGQKQRIAIARALLKDAPLLLLDEATSALDTETENQVQEALDRLMKGRTTMIIAHRLSTVHHADWIVYLDQGTIIEQGTHQELMDRNGAYARLYTLQFKRKPAQSLQKLGM
jgi:ATP-binding cassette, subfamily B, bacterial